MMVGLTGRVPISISLPRLILPHGSVRWRGHVDGAERTGAAVPRARSGRNENNGIDNKKKDKNRGH
jgi:hypothetical protein